MTAQELKKLSKTDLLEILLAQSREIESLKTQIEELNEKLNDKTISISNAGSIAEASLQLNGVFAAAQEACDQYIQNVTELSQKQEELCAEMERETAEKCNAMIADAEARSQQYWDDVSDKIQRLIEKTEGLKDFLEAGRK